MENKFILTVPKPCHEDWGSMPQDTIGRFCSICTKTVVDFTKMETAEIQEYFVQNLEKKVCGRFNNEQINRFDIQIPQSVLRKRRSFHKAFLLALFVVMGTTLFSCKNHNDASLGEVSVVEDTLKTYHTMGIPLPPKEGVTKKSFNTGDVSSKKYDSKKGLKTSSRISVKVEKETLSISNLPVATLGMTIVKPPVDSTKIEKK